MSNTFDKNKIVNSICLLFYFLSKFYGNSFNIFKFTRLFWKRI